MAYTPPTVGPAGLTIPSYNDIFSDNLAQYLKIFGANQYIGVDSAIYQLISILSLKQADTMKALQFAYNQSSPGTAVGAGLDRLVKINGIARKPFSFSTVQLTVTGTPGTVITNGIAQDVNGNQWALPSTVTIPGGGNITVTASATLPGNITATAGTITIIATPVSGWTSVTNAAAAIPGTPFETDSQLRARQAIAVAIPSKTMLNGTIAAIGQLTGVTRYNILENPTGAPDSFGNPAHSLTAVVEGGTIQAIAQAIYNNRGIGCLTNGLASGSPVAGTQSQNIADPTTGFVLPIGFISPPTGVPIFVIVNAHLLPGGTSATIIAIQTAIVNYLNSLQIGELVSFGALYAAAMAVTPNLSLPLFSIKSLFTGVAVPPSAPVLSQVASGALAAATYYARITYVTAAGEGAPSAESSFAVSVNNVLSVASPAASPGATGYNVYVGNASGSETKQNASPIAIGTPWQEPNSGLISGAPLAGTSDIAVLFYQVAQGLIANVTVNSV